MMEQCYQRLLSLVCAALAFWLIGASPLHAEGVWQLGLFEGASHRQPLYETVAGSQRNVLFVDVLMAGEVINILVCGENNYDRMRVQIYDPNGSQVYNNSRVGNVSCTEDFNRTFDPIGFNAHQYQTTTAGAYEVRLYNDSGRYIHRYDISITNSLTDAIDPRIDAGRLWSRFWAFLTGSFGESASTDANLYAVADGGFVGSYFVWRLDLDNFAGYGYEIKANALGVTSPNAVGDVVAGLSVPESNNSVLPQFPIYLSYPVLDFPEPIGGVNVGNFRFVDELGVDSGISPGTTAGVQDSGTFNFDTNLSTQGVYEIIIDTGSANGGLPDGEYGQGDIFLRGLAVSGANSVFWNGRDNSGVLVNQGAYSAVLSVRAGEFHFAGRDVETSGGPTGVGIKIYRAQKNGADLPTTVYWDDSTVLNHNDPNAFNVAGIYDGAHNWGTFVSTGVGNQTYIDTYTFGIVDDPNPIGVAITENDVPMPTVSKSFSPATISVGGTSKLEIEITYKGSINLSGVSLVDNLPNGMLLAQDAADINVSGTGCTGFSFSAQTQSGSETLELTDGNISGSGNTICVISVDVTAWLPGELVNQTSGVDSNELAAGVLSDGASLSVQPLASGAAFACDASIYQSDSSGLTTRLYQIDRRDSNYRRVEFDAPGYSATNGYSYGALAYHPIDKLLYAMVTRSDGAVGNPQVGSVIRIDANGAIRNLGVPQIGPNTMAMPQLSDRFSGGTITENGRYVVVTDLAATSHAGVVIPLIERGIILEIDLTTSPPQVLYNRRHGRDSQDIVAHPDGLLYSMVSSEGLIAIESATGSVTVEGSSVAFTAAGLASDPWGTIYAHAENGTVYRIDSDGSTLQTTAPLALTPQADFASCTFGVGVRKTAGSATVDGGGAVEYLFEIVNQSNAVATIDIFDELADDRRFNADSLQNPLGGTVNNYAASSTLTIANATIGANQTAVLRVAVSVPTSYPVGSMFNQARLVWSGVELLSDDPTTIAFADATSVELLASPALGIAKAAQVNGQRVVFDFIFKNLGNVALKSVLLSDDLDSVFGAGNYSIVTQPTFVNSPGTLQLSSSFDGAGNPVLLDGGVTNTLAVGAHAQLRFEVQIDTLSDTGQGLGQYQNQVLLRAETADGRRVEDLSMQGNSVDPNGDGRADEEQPTLIQILAAIRLAGQVFIDNGGTGGVSHNGIREGAEIGLSDVVLQVINAADETLVATVTSTADGRYEVNLPITVAANLLRIQALDSVGYLAVSERRVGTVPDTSVTDGRIEFTATVNSEYQIDFGRIQKALFSPDRRSLAKVGQFALHAHRFVSKSSGTLSFHSATTTATPPNAAWRAVLMHDVNCNEKLDTADVGLDQPITVDAQVVSQICLLSKIYLPSDASEGDRYRHQWRALLEYADPTDTGHALSEELWVDELTEVIASADGILVLNKSVRNVSRNGIATTSNTAVPGEVLHYVIRFENSGAGPVTEVLITDRTPAYTALSQPVSCPATVPPALGSCLVELPASADNRAGYEGDVRWGFSGTLNAGESADVDYQIVIE